MLLLLCSGLLQILFANGGFVDITLHNNNFTGIISLTYDGYFGLFSKLSGAVSPVCKFSYVFGMGSLNVSSTTCSDLNITEYGDSFECGAVDSTFFECQRMGRNSLCDNNKSWTVLYTNITSFKPCAGICSVNIDETISITYQGNITTVPESTCSRPTQSASTEITKTTSMVSETWTPAPSSSATSQITNQSSQPDSYNSTMDIHQAAKNNFNKFIPLIAGLGTGVGILIIFIIGVIVVCVKRRIKKSKNGIQRTTAMDPNVGNEESRYDDSDKTTRGNSIYGRDLNKLSGIDLDVLDNVRAVGNDSTHNNKNINMNKRSNLATDQVYSEIGMEQLRSEENNKNSVSGSSTTSDKDTGYLEVSVPTSDGQPNDKTSTTSPSHSNRIDSGYEVVGGPDKPISNTYARLGDSVREFENPYNETSLSDNNLKETDSGHGEKKPRHNIPDTLEITPGPDDNFVVVEPSDVYAQVMKTKKPDFAISYV